MSTTRVTPAGRVWTNRSSGVKRPGRNRALLAGGDSVCDRPSKHEHEHRLQRSLKSSQYTHCMQFRDAQVRSGNALLILLTASLAINYLIGGALSVAAPLIVRDLNISPTQMGLLFSAFFWSYSSFQLVAGWAVDRYPVKWVYATGFLVWSLATAVGLVNGLGALLVARLALGVGESVKLTLRRQRSLFAISRKDDEGWRTLLWMPERSWGRDLVRYLAAWLCKDSAGARCFLL